MSVELNFPDQTYTSSNKPSVETLKNDLSTIEQELDTVSGSLVGTSDTQTLTNKTLTAPTITSPVINTQITGTAVLDEDDMASDSDTKIATQQSIKAYVDNATSTLTNPTIDTPTIDLGSNASDTTYNGTTITMTAGENLVWGNWVYLKEADGKIWKVDADASSTSSSLIGFVTEEISADDTGKVLVYGIVRDDSWSLTIGGKLFASTIAGGVTHTAPSGSGDCIIVAGKALSATEIFVNPSEDYIIVT